MSDHFQSIDLFPIIIQSTLYNDTKDLNQQLLTFIKALIDKEDDASTLNYITTENGAKQPDVNILLEFYGKVDCITELVDNIITPAQKRWTDEHFQRLIGKTMPTARYNLQSWATYYPPGSWQTPHIHRDKMFTGIYYLKMPEQKIDKNTDGNDFSAEGTFVIQNPHIQSSQPALGGWQTHREILPQEGELIILPSWLTHFVKPFSTGERCVIVFDGQFVG